MNWYKCIILATTTIPNPIVAAAYRDISTGKIYTGATHYQAYQEAYDDYISRHGKISFSDWLDDKILTKGNAENEGFITKDNKFVSRQEALFLANNSKQTNTNKSERDWLDSSDI